MEEELNKNKKVRKKNKKKAILINKMYTGRYINEYQNIGHEIINFLLDDVAGNNYLYITPYGKYDSKHYEITHILLAGPKQKNEYEIIAKAEVEKDCFEKKDKRCGIIYRSEDKYNHEKQVMQYKYGGYYLYDVFKNNQGNDNAIYATFKVKNIEVPKSKIIVKFNNINNTTEIETEDKREELKYTPEEKKPLDMGQRGISYVTNDNYNIIINNIITNEKLWEPKAFETDWKKNEQDIKNNFSFINLVKKEYDELAYSSMLSYYFNVKYGEKQTIIFNLFLKWISKNDNIDISFKNIEDYDEVVQEKPLPNHSRPDMIAKRQNSEDKIIIENKIKSGINGEQLLEYYKQEQKENKGNFKGLIFVPDYNVKQIKNDERYKEVSDKYGIIEYSQIYEFFKNEIKLEKLEGNSNKYFEDLKNALYIQTITEEKNQIYRLKNAMQGIDNISYQVHVLKLDISKNKKQKYQYYVGVTNNYSLQIDYLKSKVLKNKPIENISENVEKLKNIENIEKAFKIKNALEEEIEKEVKIKKDDNLTEDLIKQIAQKI